jgi:integrase
LEAYIEGARLAGDPKGPLFRSAEWKPGAPLTRRAISQSDVYRMIGRRAEAAGIKTKIGCHTFRATGITAYLKNGGWKSPRRSPRMSHHAPQGFTTGAAMT